MKEEKKTQQQSASFFHELGSFMKPYKGKYALSILISIAGVAIGLGAYAFAGLIASRLFSGNVSWDQIWKLALAAALCKVLHGICLNTSTWISHKAAYHTLKDIRDGVSEKLLKLPMGYFEETGSGRLKTLLVDHIENMEKTLAHLLPELTANLLAPCALLIWMFFIDWRLALSALLWIFFGFGVTSGMMRNYETKFAGQIKALKTMNQSIVEYVNGIEVIKNFGRADECYKKYEDAVYGHAAYNVGWQKETQIFTALGMAIAPFSMFPVLITGLIFYGNHTLDASTLFLMILLTFGIFGPLMNASSYMDQLAAMGVNAREIKDVLDYPELKRGTDEEIKSSDLAFSHVNFSYHPEEPAVLKDISIQVPAGSMLALVGPSGSGKSTIAKLLAGYWDADQGEILLGGKPLTSYSQEALNRQIAYVEQETFLFDCSIMDNIRMGCPEATDEQVLAATRQAGCDAFIRALPQGYETLAGEAGNRLSGGERQRIAIARAMMKQAPVLILDEATASSDPENEASIQTALSAAAKDKTLVVVAHRLSTILHADQIAYLKDGQIQSVGTHEQLLKDCPDYASMWALSKEGFND